MALFPGQKKIVTALNAGGAILAGVASLIIMQQNDDRHIASVENDSLIPVYLALGPIAVLNAGIVLQPGGAFTFGEETDFPYFGAVSVIAGGAANVVFTEA